MPHLVFCRRILDAWDPEARVREGEARIKVAQVVAIPLVMIGLIIAFPLDIISLPCQVQCLVP